MPVCECSGEAIGDESNWMFCDPCCCAFHGYRTYFCVNWLVRYTTQVSLTPAKHRTRGSTLDGVADEAPARPTHSHRVHSPLPALV